MERDAFVNNYREYKIVEDGGAKRTITLARLAMIQYKDSEELFLLDAGGWLGPAWILKVDFSTGKCYYQADEGFEYLGLLVHIPKKAERPA